MPEAISRPRLPRRGGRRDDGIVPRRCASYEIFPYGRRGFNPHLLEFSMRCESPERYLRQAVLTGFGLGARSARPTFWKQVHFERKSQGEIAEEGAVSNRRRSSVRVVALLACCNCQRLAGRGARRGPRIRLFGGGSACAARCGGCGEPPGACSKSAKLLSLVSTANLPDRAPRGKAVRRGEPPQERIVWCRRPLPSGHRPKPSRIDADSESPRPRAERTQRRVISWTSSASSRRWDRPSNPEGFWPPFRPG